MDLTQEAKPIKEPSGNLPHYVAPEVIALNYSEKCDIWSVGILAYECLSKLRPFDSFTEEHEEIYA